MRVFHRPASALAWRRGARADPLQPAGFHRVGGAGRRALARLAFIAGPDQPHSLMATGLGVGGDVEQALGNVGVPSYVLDRDRKSCGRSIRRPSSFSATSAVATSPPSSHRGKARCPRAIRSEDARHLPGQRGDRPPGSTAGARVAVEVSAVALKDGETVVGVFGLIEGRPDDRPTAPAPTSDPSSSRGASSSGAGPLDEADRRRAPPE